MGLLGKAGAILAGVAPLATSGVEAMAKTQTALVGMKIGEKVSFFAMRFINNLCAGFGLPDPYAQTPGGHAIGNGWVGGTPHLYTTAAGVAMVLVDAVISKLLKTSTRVAGIAITGRY